LIRRSLLIQHWAGRATPSAPLTTGNLRLLPMVGTAPPADTLTGFPAYPACWAVPVLRCCGLTTRTILASGEVVNSPGQGAKGALARRPRTTFVCLGGSAVALLTQGRKRGLRTPRQRLFSGLARRGHRRQPERLAAPRWGHDKAPAVGHTVRVSCTTP